MFETGVGLPPWRTLTPAASPSQEHCLPLPGTPPVALHSFPHLFPRPPTSRSCRLYLLSGAASHWRLPNLTAGAPLPPSLSCVTPGTLPQGFLQPHVQPGRPVAQKPQWPPSDPRATASRWVGRWPPSWPHLPRPLTDLRRVLPTRALHVCRRASARSAVCPGSPRFPPSLLPVSPRVSPSPGGSPWPPSRRRHLSLLSPSSLTCHLAVCLSLSVSRG